MEQTSEIRENKIVVAERVPPGDRWVSLLPSSPNPTLDSLTDMLEHIYQETNCTKFYIDAREGTIETVELNEVIIEPEPEKKYSLYGEH